MSDSREACPCLHIEPCSPDCTCVKPASSRGCKRCCSYGSKEQQVKAANRLTHLQRELSDDEIVEIGFLHLGMLGGVRTEDINFARAIQTAARGKP